MKNIVEFFTELIRCVNNKDYVGKFSKETAEQLWKIFSDMAVESGLFHYELNKAAYLWIKEN